MKNLPSLPPQIPDNQIPALIQLLSDQDERIAQNIHNRLVAVGQPALSFLEQAQADLDNLTMADRIAAVIADIHQPLLEEAFHALTSPPTDEVDLETGAFLIARVAYPNLDVEHYQQCLNDMADDIKRGWKAGLDLQESMTAINEYLFGKHQFKGNTHDYYDPDNSFLNQVLDRRLGIPISLSVIFLLLSKRLNLPLVGVGMPGHFLVSVPKIELYIDCFNQGAQLSKEDCKKFFKEYGHPFESHFLDPTPPRQILARMVRNLISIYQNRDDSNRANQFSRIFNILVRTNNPGER